MQKKKKKKKKKKKNVFPNIFGVFENRLIFHLLETYGTLDIITSKVMDKQII